MTKWAQLWRLSRLSVAKAPDLTFQSGWSNWMNSPWHVMANLINESHLPHVGPQNEPIADLKKGAGSSRPSMKGASGGNSQHLWIDYWYISYRREMDNLDNLYHRDSLDTFHDMSQFCLIAAWPPCARWDPLSRLRNDPAVPCRAGLVAAPWAPGAAAWRSQSRRWKRRSARCVSTST